MVRPSHELSNIVVGGIRDYAEQLAEEEGRDVDHDEAHEQLLRMALVDVGILPPGCDNSRNGTGSKSEGDPRDRD